MIFLLLKWLTCLLTALSAFGIAQGGKGKSCKLSKLTAGAVCAWHFCWQVLQAGVLRVLCAPGPTPLLPGEPGGYLRIRPGGHAAKLACNP